MPYKATHDMVQRVMPLLEQLAETRIDKARLLQYLAAQSAVDWGVMFVVADEQVEGRRLITYRDKFNSSEHQLQYPSVLAADIEPLALAEYKRLAVDKPLTKMDRAFFDHLYGLPYCARCRYRGLEFEQFHAECHFAGHPVNFEAE
jgi:hypothetical protein